MQNYGLIVADNGSNWYLPGQRLPAVAGRTGVAAEGDPGECVPGGQRVVPDGSPELGRGSGKGRAARSASWPPASWPPASWQPASWHRPGPEGGCYGWVPDRVPWLPSRWPSASRCSSGSPRGVLVRQQRLARSASSGTCRLEIICACSCCRCDTSPAAGFGPLEVGRDNAGERIVGPRRGQRQHVAEVGRRRVAGGERWQAPAQLDRLEHRGVVDRRAARGHAVDRAGRDQRRDQDGGDPDAEPGEVEAELAGAAVRRRGARGRRHVVVAPAVLVVGDDQQRLVPARPAAQRLVDLLDQRLAERDVVVGVLAVAGRSPARLQEAVGGQRAGRGSRPGSRRTCRSKCPARSACPG